MKNVTAPAVPVPYRWGVAPRWGSRRLGMPRHRRGWSAPRICPACGLDLDGNPDIAAHEAPALRAVRINCLSPNAGFSDVYRCTGKEDYFRNCSKESCPERNTNQMLMKFLLSPSLAYPCAERNGKICLAGFTAEKTIWQSCTGNQSYVASFFNLSNIHKSSIFIKSMYSHFYKEV